MTIYEKMQELSIGKKIQIEELPIYFPCPDRVDKYFFNTIEPFIKGNIKDSFKKTQCCGLGGCAGIKEGEISKKMAKSIALANEDKVYTYCASCVGNFKRNGFNESYHLLSLILGIDENVPLGIKTVLNRASFKFK